jgi:hypothetical protein
LAGIGEPDAGGEPDGVCDGDAGESPLHAAVATATTPDRKTANRYLMGMPLRTAYRINPARSPARRECARDWHGSCH